jgi:hypothetical protein
MHKHSRFYYVHFIAGGKNTPEEAHRTLNKERSVLQKELTELELERLRDHDKNKNSDATAMMTNDLTMADRLKELLASSGEAKVGVERAIEKEIAFIDKLLKAVEKHFEHPELSPEEAYEKCQRQEALLEILTTAENMVLTMGGVPPDALKQFRLHPDFAAIIMPAVNEMMQMQRSKQGFPLHGMTKWLGAVIRELSTEYPDLEPPANLLVPNASIVGPDGRPAC